MSLRRTAVLARWLGPWAKPDRSPATVTRRTVAIPPEKPDDRELTSFFYLPARGPARGAYLVTPGLHYNGPDDPRLERFCRILAATGAAVLCPSLPDYRKLRVTPRTPGDLERAFDALLKQPEVAPGTKPAVFAISFGSLPALRLAAGPRCGPRVSTLLLFGGFADFKETIRYALTGEIDGKKWGTPDPLNHSVVFLNVTQELEGMPADPEPVMAAWHCFCTETWGKEDMKAGGWTQVAERLERELPENARAMFRMGLGLDARAKEVGLAALARCDTEFCDPSRGGLEGIRCPVHIVHGADDNVIPSNQLAKIKAALPPHVKVTTNMTGLYGHADSSGMPGPLALARELRTLIRILRMLATAPG